MENFCKLFYLKIVNEISITKLKIGDSASFSLFKIGDFADLVKETIIFATNIRY